MILNCQNIIEAMESPEFLGETFAHHSWTGWKIFLKALYALPLNPRERVWFKKFTGREAPPVVPVSEAWLIVGRKGGKSQIAALVAVWQACSKDWTDRELGPGGVGTIPIIAADRKQSRTILRYVKGLLESAPELKRLIANVTKESIELANRTLFEIHTASYKTTRGYTVISAICDEVSFWRSEDSANPDKEILDALRPNMGLIPGSILFCITTPYARRGETWYTFRDYFGREGSPVLVWQAQTRQMNANFPQSIIDRAMERDEASAKAEYLAIFREDLETFISEEQLKAVITPNVTERPYIPGKRYFAFVDTAGGGGQDSYTLAISARDGNVGELCLVVETRPPFDHKDVTKAYAEILRRYQIHSVVGDRYAGNVFVNEFKSHLINMTIIEKFKSDLYLELLPLITGKSVRLLDMPKLLSQLRNLERRTARGGRDSVDHSPMSHDDVANAAAGALVLAVGGDVLPQPAGGRVPGTGIGGGVGRGGSNMYANISRLYR